MRNSNLQSDLTLVQPNSSYLTKHVCFETWSLTLPSLFWWNLMKNKSQLFRHLNIPFQSILREEFNGAFRFSIHSAKLELFHKTYISFSSLFTFTLFVFVQGSLFFPPISRGISLTGLNRNMKNMRKPSAWHSRTVLGMILSKKIKENPKIHRWYEQKTHFLQFQLWRVVKININFTLISVIFINE